MTENFYLNIHKEDKELITEAVDEMFNKVKSSSWDWSTDPYVKLAAEVFETPIDKVTAKQRTAVKSAMLRSCYP